jgi:hypothetical protein
MADAPLARTTFIVAVSHASVLVLPLFLLVEVIELRDLAARAQGRLWQILLQKSLGTPLHVRCAAADRTLVLAGLIRGIEFLAALPQEMVF